MPGGGALAWAATLALAGGVAGHVSLLWPPARGIGLDFLDNSRTPGDCGVLEGEHRTLLTAGSTINVTWHLGYPHGGGYRLEVISPSKGLNQQILPANSNSQFETEDARFSQSHVVRLPQDMECEDCFLRLIRQATEWGKSYIFRSCADVRIEAAAAKDCGEGTLQGGDCVCPRGWEGDLCQYKTECKDDMDCNEPKGQGKCIITDNKVYRIGKCYCAPGWQGIECNTPSQWDPADAKQIVSADYASVTLAKNVTLLWRRLEGEVELVLTAPTLSWVALGWRPKDSTNKCQAFPSSMPKPIFDFHPMDCTDMVVGAAREGFGWAGDYYTRDRSTPRADRDYGGEDDITSSHVWEDNGKTTLRIIRKTEGGVADHPLQGELHLIWAHGQDGGFYLEDQLKYHGKTARGVSALNLGVGEDGGLGLNPMQIGLGISVALLLLLILLQVAQNLDKKLSCLNPFTYKAFN